MGVPLIEGALRSTLVETGRLGQWVALANGGIVSPHLTILFLELKICGKPPIELVQAIISLRFMILTSHSQLISQREEI